MIRFPFLQKTASAEQEAQEDRLRSDLVQSEARNRVFFEVIDDGFCIIQFVDGPRGPLSDYVHVEANTGYERHTGITGIVGKTVYDVAPQDGGEWVKIYGAVLETGAPIRFEREFTEAGRFIEVSARRVEPKSLNQVAVLFRDVTERRQREAALRASEKLAQENAQRVQLALAAGAIVGTWVWEIPEDKFVVDDAFCRAMGFDPAIDRALLTYDAVIEHVHPDDRQGLLDRVADALRLGGPYAHQYRVLHDDRKYHWIEANGRVDFDAEGKPATFPGVLIDIGERRAVEAERDRVTAELFRLNETLEQRVAEQTAELMAKEEVLRQAQKMEAIGQLTGGVAHDFNNLLAAVSGALEMVRTRMAQGRAEEVERYLGTAQTAAERAATLTQRLLAFSRRQSLEPKVTDLEELARGMEEMVQRSVGPQIEVSTTADAGVWPALVDRNQMENALLNLCINARDAMPGGGRLHIQIANRTLDAAAARERELAPGDYVVVAISDTGTGMSAEDIGRAFEPFFTTKPIGEGTGLGLSMVYGFAQQSGGQAMIRSEVGQGTTVEVWLPRSAAAAPAEAVPAAAAASPAGDVTGRTVLVVEDEVLVRMMVVDALGDLGLKVLEAGSGPEALEVLGASAKVDLLLTDIGLPKGMNGRQLAEIAQQRDPTLKVIFATGYDEAAVAAGGSVPGDTEVVRKPFRVESLTARVTALLST